MKYETRLIWVLTITFGFVFLDRNAASYLMPFIASDLHFNNSQVGLVASALSFTWAVAAFLGGAYSDRTGNRKNLLLIAVVAFSLCSFASGLAASFVTLFSTRLLMGLAEGPIHPISQSLVSIESTAARRGNNMGVMQNFGSNLLGSFAAPLVLVAVASAYNWRWAFYLAGVPGLIMALLIAKFVRQPAAATPAQTTARLAESSMGYGEMLQHRNMWLCMLMAIFMVAWMVLGWAFLPLFYTTVRQLNNGQMSVLMSVLGLSAAFFSFVVPALSDRFGRRPVIVIFNFIGLLVPLAALHFQGSLFMLGTLIFVGWSASGTFPLFMATVPSETIPARYVATSLGSVSTVFDTHPYARWLSVSLVSTIAAVPARALVNRTPWPWWTRIGTGFAGAAVVSFAGVMLAGAAHLVGASAFLVAAVFGIAMSLGVQWKVQNGAFDWSDFL